MRDNLVLGQRIWDILRSIPTSEAIRYVSEYLEEDAEGRPRFTGRCFELLGGTGQVPMRLTAEDLLSVSFLSVDVPASAAWQLLTRLDATVSSLLVKIPTELTIESEDCDYDFTFGSLSALQQLWELVRHGTEFNGKKWGIGPTIASKILARKRPNLVPVQDEVVVRILGIRDKDYWRAWWEAMHLDIEGRRPVVEFANNIRSESGAAHLSLLRTLDIVLWRAGRERC
ncbi:DUF6308 family protein [Glutamicibacter arilaitensis]|uniref:DUF6308 family protein n=1 Tax=Glutamicibacter arilaitensis TaxID=256701 RepID=UPI003F918AB7